MNFLVEMKGIEKRFPGVHALKGVQFDLRPGEVHALMGENGAGKSTLMKIMSGIYARDGGDMFVDGKPVAPGSPRAAQDLGIGIIHQELSLMRDLTAAQNVLIGREPRKSFGRLDEPALNKQTAEIFASLNLDMDPRTPVGTQTIARQQLIEIAKALSYNPRVLIMDEPTAALNDAEISELFGVVRKLKATGVGIVYISHRMDEIKRIADRVTVLRDGAYIDTVDAHGTPLAKIIQLMVGREVTQEALAIPDTSHNPIALDVRNLSRGKDVQNVSFNLRKGEILGFAGLMGAGRTEVARIIFGADRRETGEIAVHGEQTDIRSPADAVAAGIGYLSEDRKHFGLAVDMNVRANIAMTNLTKFSNQFWVLDERAMKVTAQDYIKQLGIRTPSDLQDVRLLSGGNQQKVVIAKWLLRDCDVLIFDEPTRGIDIGAKSEIYALLEDLAAQGKAIIVISSELPEVMRLSHRIAVMCEGRLTGILPGGAATTQEDIMELATQRDDALRIPEDAA
ncbi:sugar ABC transporter ATP-binding protein [Meridianimarinicoccus aquatilis]|uniref:Sugar ABC transporter ATP-binding protein n=1 Tax=Meridianimarinicoccus aquatilis TaxID=2552766 RepID=A0A4R6B106_9RHOB|nr:sugar ABC transporter ATP-binding protein [Fluviibacterium aquatile]TDL90821.1 sugar ABC transporter ATP-binding protein [Fluviibacterium aquatile]